MGGSFLAAITLQFVVVFSIVVNFRSTVSKHLLLKAVRYVLIHPTNAKIVPHIPTHSGKVLYSSGGKLHSRHVTCRSPKTLQHGLLCDCGRPNILKAYNIPGFLLPINKEFSCDAENWVNFQKSTRVLDPRRGKSDMMYARTLSTTYMYPPSFAHQSTRLPILAWTPAAWPFNSLLCTLLCTLLIISYFLVR